MSESTHDSASRRSEPHRGRHADAPTDVPKRGWKDVFLRTKDEIKRDNLSIVAAGVAFYAFLSIPAILTATVSIWGLVADPADVQRDVSAMAGVLPDDVRTILTEQLTAVSGTSNDALGWTAAISILLALWSGQKGTKAVITALNIAYEEEENRGFLRQTAVTLGLTLGAVVTVILALVCVAVIPALFATLSPPKWLELTIGIARWPLLALIALGALAVLYKVAPSRSSPKWRWVSVGSILATILWLAASALFSWYVSSLGNYNETYGSLGGVVVLLMWLYLSAFIILLGAELNSELEHQTSRDSTTGPEEPMGQRNAAMADTLGESRS